MNSNAIQTTQLTRDFGTVRAVDNLTLTVPRGIVFGFLGPNGSGKTTTIRMLLGLLDATSGTAHVLGYDTATDAHQIRAQTGTLMEHNGLYERLTAEDNLEFYGRIYRMPRSERKARIKELLTHMDLWERRDGMVGDWSKGMRQKLAVARALLHRPPLVILDEPTSGLDPVAAANLRDDLAGLVAHEGVTVFLNTHNLPEAEKLCQQVGVIREGKLAAVGDIATLRQQETPRLEIVGRNFTQGVLAALRAFPNVTSVQHTVANESERLLLELAHPTDPAQFVSAVVSAGGQIAEVKRVQSSLEDVFLSLVNEQKTKV